MMASYLSYHPGTDDYHIGPPVAGAAEDHQDCAGTPMQCQHVTDPTFEITQFAVTLTIANEWRTRLGEPLNETCVPQIITPPAPMLDCWAENGPYTDARFVSILRGVQVGKDGQADGSCGKDPETDGCSS
jgi:hypothetical protein